MAIINLQTLTSHASYTAAIAGIPGGAWPAGGYELRADDDAIYAEQISVNPTTVNVADKGAELLVLSGRPGGSTRVQAPGAPGSGAYIYGINDVFVRQINFIGVTPSSVTTHAAVRIGEIGGTKLLAHRITIDRCGLGQAELPWPAYGVYISGTGQACEDIRITGGPGLDPLTAPSTMIGRFHTTSHVYAEVATRLQIDFATFLDAQGTNAIDIRDSTGVILDRVFMQNAEGRFLYLLRCDRSYLINSQLAEGNESSLATEYVRIDNCLGFAGWLNSIAHLNEAQALAAGLINFRNAPGLAQFEGNIFFLAGNSFVYDIEKSSSLSALLSRYNLFYRLDGVGQIARVSFPQTEDLYPTLLDWQTTGNDPGGLPGQPRAVEADPEFLSALTGAPDLRLMLESPARNIAPTSFSAAFTPPVDVTPVIDYLNQPRPSGGLNDAGFIELQAGLATVSPSIVERNGGYRIQVSGLVVPDGTYRMHLGPQGTVDDVTCYAGAYGDGFVGTVVAGEGSFVSPPLPSGGPYSVTIEGVGDLVGVQELIPDAVTYVYENHRSRVYGVRTLLIPWWATGPRRVDEEDLLP